MIGRFVSFELLYILCFFCSILARNFYNLSLFPSMPLEEYFLLSLLTSWISYQPFFMQIFASLNGLMLFVIKEKKWQWHYFFVYDIYHCHRSTNYFYVQLVECPSIYEMLANLGFNWHAQPQIQVWRKSSVDGKTSVDLKSYGPTDSIALFEEALRNNEVYFTLISDSFVICLNFGQLKRENFCWFEVIWPKLKYYFIYHKAILSFYDYGWCSKSFPIQNNYGWEWTRQEKDLLGGNLKVFWRKAKST